MPSRHTARRPAPEQCPRPFCQAPLALEEMTFSFCSAKPRVARSWIGALSTGSWKAKSYASRVFWTGKTATLRVVFTWLVSGCGIFFSTRQRREIGKLYRTAGGVGPGRRLSGPRSCPGSSGSCARSGPSPAAGTPRPCPAILEQQSNRSHPPAGSREQGRQLPAPRDLCARFTSVVQAVSSATAFSFPSRTFPGRRGLAGLRVGAFLRSSH